MKILITGANGMLGQDLVPVLEDEDFEIIETDLDTLDITNFEQAKKVISDKKPDYVIHCAAYTNVDGAEGAFESAQQINTLGTENIARICAEQDITMIYLSTDYVFDGETNTPYTPNNEPNPINIYGKTKLKGELAVKKYCKKYYIVRTSWLYGHHGANFVEKMISQVDKLELKVVNDRIGCPTWTVELSNAILDLIEDEPEFGIYHICGSGQTSWFEFAKEIFKLMKKEVNLVPCSSNEFATKAKRPKYSVMNNDKCCRNWKIALKDYMSLRD